MAAFDGSAFAGSLPFTLAAVVVLLGLTFAVALRVGKHAVIDVAWGLGFVTIAVTSYLTSRLIEGDEAGDPLRGLTITVLTAIWGIRLAVHIGRRSRGQGEDPRYTELLSRATGNPRVYAFTRIYLTQGAIMWFISLPIQVAAFQTPALGVIAWVGIVVWAVGIVFETVGDWQLQRFRDDPDTKGRVLDTGLWRYTRHPNYFGDACVWWGLSLIAFDAWPGILTLISPVVMTWLLANGTGKPLLEKGMSGRRPGYDEYVRRTSGFIPLPPRRRTT